MKKNFKPKMMRRNYLINKDFQGKYIFSYFILVALGVITFSLLFSLFAADTLSVLYDNHTLRIGSTPGVLFDKFLEATWIFIVLGAFIIIVYSILLTHRVAGPNYRFERTLESFTQGNFDLKVVLREKDTAQELAVAFNRFIEIHSAKLRTLQHMSNEIDHILKLINENKQNGENKQNSPDTTTISSMEHLKQIQLLNSRIQKILYEFKVISD